MRSIIVLWVDGWVDVSRDGLAEHLRVASKRGDWIRGAAVINWGRQHAWIPNRYASQRLTRPQALKVTSPPPCSRAPVLALRGLPCAPVLACLQLTAARGVALTIR